MPAGSAPTKGSHSKTAGPGVPPGASKIVTLAAHMKKALLIVVAALLLLSALFKVDINPQFSLPRDVERADAKQEALFDECVAEQDRIVHGETFAAIDNPDVQREVLSTRMEEATRQCRDQYPRRVVTISEPFKFNLVDLEFRF